MKTTMRAAVAALLLLLLPACDAVGSPPAARTTTAAEREWAGFLIGKARIAIVAAQATGNLDSAKAQLALAQVAAIQEDVDNSAEVPVSWTTVVDRLTVVALEWAIPMPKAGDNAKPQGE